MRRIGVLSDTHGTVPQQVYTFFKDCDELWHAGDIPLPLSSMVKWKSLSFMLSRIVSFTSVEFAAVEFSIKSYTCIDNSFIAIDIFSVQRY